MEDVGNRRYVAFVAPRQDDPGEDRRLQAQVDVVRRWWAVLPAPQVLTPAWQPGQTTRNAMSLLADRLTQVRTGSSVGLYVTGHGDEGPVSTEYRLRIDGGSYDPAALLEAIWDSDADDALVVLDSCSAYRFAQRAANLYGDRVRQPVRTPPKMVLVVPGVATDLRTEPRFEELTDIIAEALCLVSMDNGYVEPYTALADEPYLTPARLRAALEAAPGELARVGRPAMIRPQVQAFAAEWDEPCPALPNPAYDPAAQAANPATADLTLSAETIDAYTRLACAAADPRPPAADRRDLPIVAFGSFVVSGDGRGMDRPVIDPTKVAARPPDPHKVDKTPRGNPAWYFTGRAPVMAQVVRWLTNGDEPLLVVTGARGTGKSAVLSRAVTLADPGFGSRYPTLAQAVPPRLVPPAGSVHVAVDARGRTSERVAELILGALGAARTDEPGTSIHERLAQGLKAASTDKTGGLPVCVVVDSVDESVQPEALVHEVLGALVRTCHDDGRPAARVLVGVRHDATSDTDLLTLVEALASHTVVRTDHDVAGEVRSYCLRLLRSPGSPYYDRPADAEAVADLLGRSDQPSFVDVRIVAESLASSPQVADLDTLDLVGDVLLRALRRTLADQAATTARPATQYLAALRALAFARGAGTPWGAVWPTLASAVADKDVGNDLLRELLRGPLAAFVMTASEDGQRVFRPAHATIADMLRQRPDALVDGLVVEPEEVVEARIARRLGALVGDTPDPYLRRHLVAHAAAGSVLVDEVVPAAFLPWETSGDLRRRLGLPLPDGQATRSLAAWAAVEPHLDQIPTLGRRRQALRFALLRTPDDGPDELGWRTWTAPRNVLAATTGPVAALAFGQVGGRSLLVGASGDEVRCWDPATGQVVGEPLRGHEGRVLSLAFGQVNGRMVLATGGADQTVRLWNPATGEQLGVLNGHTGAVWAVTFGRIDQRVVLATGSADQTAQLWDLPAGGPPAPHEPLPHRAAVRTVAFGTVAGATALATGCADGTARLWDPCTNQRIDRPLRHGNRVLAVKFGPAGASGTAPLATSSDDGSVRVWDPVSGSLVARANHPGLVETIAWGQASGRILLATGGLDRTARLWDASDMSWNAPDEEVLPLVGDPLRGHGRSVQAVAFGRVDGRVVVATGSDDRTLRLWDPARELVRGRSERPASAALPVARPQGGRHRAYDQAPTGAHSRYETGPGWSDQPGPGAQRYAPTPEELAEVEALAAELLGDMPLPPPPQPDPTPEQLAEVDALAAELFGDMQRPPQPDPTPEQLAEVDALAAELLGDDLAAVHLSGPDGSTNPVSTPPRGTPQAVALGEDDPSPVVHAVAAAPGVLATGGADHAVRLWDPVTGQGLRHLRGHDGPVLAAAFGCAGTLLATAGDDGTVRLWDLVTGQPACAPLSTSALGLAFGEVDGRTVVVTGGPDRTVRMWDVTTGRPVGDAWHGHNGWVSTVAAGQVAGTTVVATGSFDCTVRLWDPDGSCRAVLAGHDGPVESVAFGTVDGTPVLATVADDRTARLWDPATGELVGVLTGHRGAVGAVAFGTVDGTTVMATAADDRTVRLWNPATGRHVGESIPVLVRVHDLAFADDGRLALATDTGTAVVTPALLVAQTIPSLA